MEGGRRNGEGKLETEFAVDCSDGNDSHIT